MLSEALPDALIPWWANGIAINDSSRGQADAIEHWPRHMHLLLYEEFNDGPIEPSAFPMGQKGDRFATKGWVTNLFHVVYATRVETSRGCAS